MVDEIPNWAKDFTPRQNASKAVAKSDGELETEVNNLSTEDAISLIGGLLPLATAALEKILRSPTKHAAQVVAAAKLVYERKLGAIPDTVIQNNMQFIVKWED